MHRYTATVPCVASSACFIGPGTSGRGINSALVAVDALPYIAIDQCGKVQPLEFFAAWPRGFLDTRLSGDCQTKTHQFKEGDLHIRKASLSITVSAIKRGGRTEGRAGRPPSTCAKRH